MKKYIKTILTAAAAAALLCSCGKGGGLFAEPTPTPMPSTDAGALISLEEAQSAVGDSYTLQMEGGAVAKEGNTTTASYVADPIGDGDPVIVKLVSYTSSFTPDDVWAGYENTRISRSASKFVDNIGEDAYIAYPSIHVYDRGCEIIITAGSGSDDGQDDILKKLASTAVGHLNAVMPEVK